MAHQTLWRFWESGGQVQMEIRLAISLISHRMPAVRRNASNTPPFYARPKAYSYISFESHGSCNTCPQWVAAHEMAYRTTSHGEEERAQSL
jgi:hypothetical protein